MPVLTHPIKSPVSKSQVVVVRTRTREERDAELRANAVDLETEPVAKRSKSRVGNALGMGRPDTSAATSSSGSTAPAAAAASTSYESAPIEGLAHVVRNLPPSVQEAAQKWCEETDTASMHLVVELQMVDALVDALGLKKGGNNERAVRQRLEALASQST